MAVRFCPIASGSSGNSVYIGTDNTHILIDAGLNGKQLESNLASINVHPSCLDAILITHEHGDHIKGAGVLSRRFGIPIYATYGTWEAIDKGGLLGKLSERNRLIVYKEENCIINDICVRPFEIPHDCADPVGYSVYTEKLKISVATDIGHVTESIAENIYDSSILLLESNHDIELLKNGPYPYILKKRILGKNGHLSNVAAGELIADIITDKLKYIFLGHLSEENNCPTLAFNTVKGILDSKGAFKNGLLNLIMAERYTASRFVKI